MQDGVRLSKEGPSLVLDIYLGGVSGAIVKKQTIEYVSHNKVIIPEDNVVMQLLQKTELLLQKTVEDLLSKKEVFHTYIFIDAPFSYTESHTVLFQNTDRSFFETKAQEIQGNAILLPQSYQNLLGDHAKDGVVIEHAPTNHTINGYSTKNIHLEGERKATVSQQWIQREIFRMIQELKKTFSLGEIIFLSLPEIEKNKAVLMLGDVISGFRYGYQNILIGSGTYISIERSALTHNISTSFIESTLKGIARSHASKDRVYKDITHHFEKSFSKAFKQIESIHDKKISCTYIGNSFMFPVIKDALSSFKNIDFVDNHTKPDARLLYIIQNKVQ